MLKCLFNSAALILNQYLCAILEPIPNTFCWRHGVLTTLPFTLIGLMGFMCTLLVDSLYRSYQGTILKALHVLSF